MQNGAGDANRCGDTRCRRQSIWTARRFATERIGYGAGHESSFADFPNCVRLMLGEETSCGAGPGTGDESS